VVTSIVGVLPSTGSVMTHVVPGGRPLMANGAGVVAPAAMVNVVGVPLHVATIWTGPCWPASEPAMTFDTMSEPDVGVQGLVTVCFSPGPIVTVSGRSGVVVTETAGVAPLSGSVT